MSELSAERLAEIRRKLPASHDRELAHETGKVLLYVDFLFDHIDTLTAEIAELTKPVEDAEVAAIMDWLKTIAPRGMVAVCVVHRLAREVAALKVERDTCRLSNSLLSGAAGGAHERLLVMQDQQIATEAKLAEAVAEKDGAYAERNQLVAYLASQFPSGTKPTNIPGWLPEWHGCVYIDTPAGQMSWHYHDSQAGLFAHTPPYTGEWDGHATETKYARLAAITKRDKP
jgi:hypothetical protein